MKKYILFLLPLTTFLIFSKCEKDDIVPNLPASIKNYLDAQYPGYEAEELDEETFCNGGKGYEVEIETSGDDELELTFDTEGTLLFTKTEIKTSDLPAAVKTSVATNFPGYKMKEAGRLDMNGGGVRYEAELKNGSSVKEVLFETTGTVVCEEVENENDED